MTEAWKNIRRYIGELWSKWTTAFLGLLVAVQPALEMLDPSIKQMLPGWARLLLGLFGVIVIIARFAFPPPPSVQIKEEDAVAVNRFAGSVTVFKANPDDIPADMKTKLAGEPREPPVV